jgi:glycolate oxidase iron-sulfur subunit
MAGIATQSNAVRDQRFDHVEADLCVACGLCLPVCPTYRLDRDENESPRGRLSLIRGLASGQLEPDRQLADHLHRCTLCLSCESVCPAKVGFGEQMSRARDWLHDQGHWSYTLVEKFLLDSLRKGDTRMKRVGQLARTYQRSPIRRLLRGSGLLRATGLERTDTEMPEFSGSAEFEETYPAVGTEKGRASLFTGCLQNQTDPETLPATIKLLIHLGYTVDVPPVQNCCGGLHLHGGDHDEAEHLARKNASAFSGAQTIVGVASGCGAVIKQYEHLLGDDGAATASAYRDITAFLTEGDAVNKAEFLPLPAKVLVHEPCSHRNQLKQSEGVYEILGKIPQLEIKPLPDNEFCCGGAGSYSLSEPELAQRMREPKLDALAELRPDYLVTTNIGCALHLKAGLAARDIPVEILHPVTLLARQLQSNEQDIDAACPEPQTEDMV